MKESYFNYYLELDDKGIIFNGLTKRFFLVSKNNFLRFISIMRNPDLYYPQIRNRPHKMTQRSKR